MENEVTINGFFPFPSVSVIFLDIQNKENAKNYTAHKFTSERAGYLPKNAKEVWTTLINNKLINHALIIYSKHCSDTRIQRMWFHIQVREQCMLLQLKADNTKCACKEHTWMQKRFEMYLLNVWMWDRDEDGDDDDDDSRHITHTWGVLRG